MTTIPVTASYRAVELRNVGGPDALQPTELATPEPGRREVLVRVLAAGVAFAQVLMRRGIYAYAPPFPFTPGAEIAGEIVACGAEVSEWRAGERVLAFTGTGGYAELAVVRADSLVRLPDEVDPVAAAALPMNYVTAYHLLHRCANVRRGEWVLVHGASGGVGTALLQLAALAGARVVGTASAAKLELVRSLGARGLDHSQGNIANRARIVANAPMDVVLDPLGGDHVLESARALRPGGRLVVYGYAAPGAATPEAAGTLRSRIDAWNAEPGGIHVSSYSLGALVRQSPQVIRDDLATLVGLLAAGRIRPIIAARLPLHEATRAHELLEAGKVAGKVVLIP